MSNDDVEGAPGQNRSSNNQPTPSLGNIWKKFVDFAGGFMEKGGGFLFTVLLAWLFELIYGLACEGFPGGLRIFCILWFASGGAFFIGTIGGFLFGLPKVRTQSQVHNTVAPQNTDDINTDHSRYRDNTNLEEVSDWLTKIIIGLGLVEFREITSSVLAAGRAVGDAIDVSHQFGGAAIATGSLIVGFSTGFLYYYIWARVDLQKRFGDKK